VRGSFSLRRRERVGFSLGEGRGGAEGETNVYLWELASRREHNRGEGTSSPSVKKMVISKNNAEGEQMRWGGKKAASFDTKILSYSDFRACYKIKGGK